MRALIRRSVLVIARGRNTLAWCVEDTDTGAYLCDIQFELSASYAASRWCVTRSTKDADAMYVAEGKFVFGTSWDETVVRTIIADIFAQVYPGATVKIVWPSVLAVPPPAPWWKRVLAWLDKG